MDGGQIISGDKCGPKILIFTFEENLKQEIDPAGDRTRPLSEPLRLDDSGGPGNTVTPSIIEGGCY